MCSACCAYRHRRFATRCSAAPEPPGAELRSKLPPARPARQSWRGTILPHENLHGSASAINSGRASRPLPCTVSATYWRPSSRYVIGVPTPRRVDLPSPAPDRSPYRRRPGAAAATAACGQRVDEQRARQQRGRKVLSPPSGGDSDLSSIGYSEPVRPIPRASSRHADRCSCRSPSCASTA